MEETLQSEKISRIYVAGSMAALVIVGILVFYSDSRPTTLDRANKTSDDLQVVRNLTTENMLADKDNNGLTEWEEKLYRDKGYTSREEVVTEQKKAIASLSDTEKKTLDQLSDPDNLTTSFTKNAYALSLNVPEGEQSETVVNGIVSDTLANETAKLYEQITKERLNISQVSTVSAYKNYGNSLATILKSAVLIALSSNDMEAVSLYMKDKDVSHLSFYIAKEKSIAKLTDQLLKLPVPAAFVDSHLKLTNAILMYQSLLNNFSKTDTDPLRGYVSLTDYTKVINKISASGEELYQLLTKNNVVFVPKDAGYFFVSGEYK